MRQVMVRYKVKPGRVEENEELVRAVCEELKRGVPAAFRDGDCVEDGPIVVAVSRVGSHDGSRS